jgi:hypothetical protein
MHTDFLIKTINGIEYKLKLKYSNQKYMIAKFGISTVDFAKFDKYIAEIIFSCICNDESIEGKRENFVEFEKGLDNESIEYLMKIVEELMTISFPDKFKETETTTKKEIEEKKTTMTNL